MIIVTGGAGFIGSNIARGLNERGIKDVLIVDNLENGHKFQNLSTLDIADYEDKDVFIEKVKNNFDFGEVECIFHMGACSATTEWDGRYMMDNNYQYSKVLYHYAQKKAIPFIYASSAAVYGQTKVFKEESQYECPLNVYGYSKLLFDNYLRRQISVSQVVGFRYFNVYGPGENHKGGMASVAYHHNEQMKIGDSVKLFGDYDGYKAGEHERDFVYVGDIVKVMLWFMDNSQANGIFNLGTGRAQTFNEIGKAVIKHHNRGKIEYIDFPEHLKNVYQSYTQANIQALRDIGYSEDFKSVQEGVAEYLQIINGVE